MYEGLWALSDDSYAVRYAVAMHPYLPECYALHVSDRITIEFYKITGGCFLVKHVGYHLPDSWSPALG